jgi:hypothetical protein
MSVKSEGTKVFKSIDDVDFSKGQPAEIEIASGMDPDEVVFEGGPLDGQRGADAAEDADLLERIEERRKREQPEEVKAKDGEGTGDSKAPVDPEADLPELEVDEKTGEASQTEVAAPEAKAEEQSFQPNLKYTVYDQEREFPDWAKPLVTSKESEENLRDLFTKADGLDEMKTTQRRVVEERDGFRAAVDEHVQKVQDLVKLRNQSLPLFFEKTGVTEQAVLNYARQRLEAMSDETGGLERAWRAERENERSSWDRAQSQVQTQQAGASAFKTLHEQAVQTTFSSPEVKSFEEAFDRSAGKAGSFKAAFQQMGEMIHRTENGRYAVPGEVAQRLMQQYPFIKASPNNPAPTPVTPAPATTQVAAPAAAPAKVERPKAIPRVGGIGVNASPTKQRLKNLDELKAKVQAELDR